MKRPLFLKIFSFLFLVGIIPAIIFYFLTTSIYQPLLEKYSFYIESVAPEIVTEIALTHKNISIQMGLTGIFIIVLILFVSVIVARNITSPIKKLVEATKAVAKGKLETRIDIKTKDEIEELANSFNRMAKKLEETQNVLKESAKILEIKVKARTQELEEERVSLEEKVKQRTKEFQEKLEELEKFHKFAVGRELKMIELKNEIKELKAKFKK